MVFVVEVYRLAETFPKDEKYNLISQLKRCAISIPSNISEISMGSCNELLTQLELALRLNFISQQQHLKLSDEGSQIYKMILGFYNSLT